MSNRRIKVIFFDMGNTLFDYDLVDISGAKEAIREIINLYQLEKNVFQGLDLFNKAIAESSRALSESKEYKLATLTNPEIMYLMAIKGWCKRLIELTGNSPAIKQVDSVFNAFIRGATQSASLYPGVKELLCLLADRYDLGILSNALSEIARGMLENSGIKGLFKFIIISGEAGIEKPDPAIFKLALEGIRLKPFEALMVGDDLRNDIYGAKKVGMNTAWIEQSGQKFASDFKPDYVIKKIPELLDVL